MWKSILKGLDAIEKVDEKVDELGELRDQAEGVVGRGILTKRFVERTARLKEGLEENAARKEGPSDLKSAAELWDFLTKD